MANVPVPASGAAPRPDKPIHPKGLYKAFAASLTGTALEWYDFAVYSAAAAVVFPVVFFPSSDPLTGTILAFSTYAVGYVSRPVGGIIFGRLGDRIGRKKVLVDNADDHRRGHRPDRCAAGLRQHRHRRPDHPGAAALRPGRGRGRRMGRRRAALQRIRRPPPPRLLGVRGPGGPACGQPAGQRRPGRPHADADRGAVPQLRLAHRLPGFRPAGRFRPLDQAEAGRHPHLQGDRGRTANSPTPPSTRSSAGSSAR